MECLKFETNTSPPHTHRMLETELNGHYTGSVKEISVREIHKYRPSLWGFRAKKRLYPKHKQGHLCEIWQRLKLYWLNTLRTSVRKNFREFSKIMLFGGGNFQTVTVGSCVGSYWLLFAEVQWKESKKWEERNTKLQLEEGKKTKNFRVEPMTCLKRRLLLWSSLVPVNRSLWLCAGITGKMFDSKTPLS